MTRHSPCVGVCTLDTAVDLCLGCGRSRDEIAQWMALNEDQRDAVWSRLPERLAQLDVGVRLLPWTGEEIIGFVVETLRERRGDWSLGPDDAAAHFRLPPTEPIHIEVDGNSVVARTGAAKFCIRIGDKVRAFGFADSRRIVLTLPKARARMDSSSSSGIANAGDADAVDGCRQAEVPIKLGREEPNVRWLARSSDPLSIDRLKSAVPLRVDDLVRALLPHLADTTIVCETAIARIELNSASWPSAFDGVAIGENAIPIAAKTIQLPAFATAVATFHPQSFLDG